MMSTIPSPFIESRYYEGEELGFSTASWLRNQKCGDPWVCFKAGERNGHAVGELAVAGGPISHWQPLSQIILKAAEDYHLYQGLLLAVVAHEQPFFSSTVAELMSDALGAKRARMALCGYGAYDSGDERGHPGWWGPYGQVRNCAWQLAANIGHRQGDKMGPSAFEATKKRIGTFVKYPPTGELVELTTIHEASLVRYTTSVRSVIERALWIPKYAPRPDQLSPTPPPVPDPDSIVPWYFSAQKFVVENHISDGTRPNDPVTRAEWWEMIRRYHEAQFTSALDNITIPTTTFTGG